MDEVRQRLRSALEGLRAQGRYRELYRAGPVSFIHNDYLGLSGHPRIQRAGERAAREGATGSRGSRLLGGNFPEAEAAEREIADFFGAPSALLFSTGYLANLGTMAALGALVDHVVSDANNHASLIDGIRLGGRPKTVVPHGNWGAPPAELKGQALLLVTESLFSMDGDWADEAGVRRWHEGTPSWLVVDEAHAAGLFGEDGRGLAARWPGGERLVRVVTFGKSFGVAGAAVLCPPEVREWLINQARPFIFSTAPSPVAVAMIRESLEVVAGAGPLRRELWERAHRVRRQLRAALGAEVVPEAGGPWGDTSPIVPVLRPGERRAMQLAQSMRNSGFELRAIRYPTVPQGAERIRLSLNLCVSREDTDRMVKELVRRWMEFS